VAGDGDSTLGPLLNTPNTDIRMTQQSYDNDMPIIIIINIIKRNDAQNGLSRFKAFRARRPFHACTLQGVFTGG